MNTPEFEIIVVVMKDRNPGILMQFLDGRTGNPLDISSSNITPKGRFRAQGAETSYYDVTMSKVDCGFDGWAQYDWPANGLNYDPGRFEIQPFLEYASGNSPHTSRNFVKIKGIEKFAVPT